MAALVLGYWKIRGLAQPIRLQLKYLGLEFNDVLYECGGPPDYDRSCWLSVKETMGFAFPNLPYLIDGDIKITQSTAIMKYLAKKTGKLLPLNDRETWEMDMLEQQVYDLRNGFVGLCYNQKFDELKDGYIEKAKVSLKRFSDFLNDGRAWLANTLTHVDFMFYEMLDQHRLLEPTILNDFPNLQAYIERFEAIPKIKAYMESPEFMKRPCNNPTAKWK